MKTLILMTLVFSISASADWFKLEPQRDAFYPDSNIYESTFIFEQSREQYINEWSDNGVTWGSRFSMNGVASYKVEENSYYLPNGVFEVYQGNLKVGSFQTNNFGEFNFSQNLKEGNYTAKLNSSKFACAHDFVVANGGVDMSNNLNLNCYQYSGKVFDTRQKSTFKRRGRGIASQKD